MKKYFVLFALAVLVVLTGLSLRRAMTAGASTPQNSNQVAIGTSPVPVPPMVAIGTSPVPVPPIGKMAEQGK